MYNVTGTLTMHGVSKEVTLPLTVNEYTSPEGDHTWKSFTLGGSIDRTDYGINWKHNAVPDFIGNEIGIDIVVITR